MVMREVQLSNSTSFNSMTNCIQPPEVFRYAQGHTGHQSHMPHEVESSPENYAHTPGSTAVDLTFSPWLMDVPTFTSPLSRTSSLSGSEYVSTPPAYPEQSSMYHLVDQTLPPAANYIARDSQYVSNQEFGWQPNFSGNGARRSQPHLPQHPISSWQPYDYVAPSLPPNLGYLAPPYMSNIPSSAPQVGLAYHCKPESADATVRPSDASTPSSSSSSNNSDSDSDDSEYEESDSNSGQRKGSRSNSGPHHSKPHVIKLGPWNSIMDPYSQPSARHYICPMVEIGCPRRFARPEHLRRHVNTVHGDKRDHRCKVPKCATKAFSRSDNLRDHYWSHLERGGRVGKNEKMGLAELKQILGPKEKKLIKKLKKRLAETQSKQRSAEQKVRQKPQFRSKL
jgi:hypothetical protein